MKMNARLSLYLLSLIAFSAGINTPLAAQKKSASAVQAPRDSYLNERVATVGNHSITRREVIENYIDVDSKLINEYVTLKYPALQTDMRIPLTDLAKYLFADREDSLEPVIQDIMLRRALEQAAAQRHILVTEAEVAKRVNAELGTRRKSAGLSEQNPEKLALLLGDRMSRLKVVARRNLLTERLVRHDLTEQLGHSIQPADFFQASLLYVRVADASGIVGEQELNAAKKKAEEVRQEVVSGKTSFAAASKLYSFDESNNRGGNLGFLPRTLLLAELENAVLKLQPNEVTAPIRNREGYVLLQLVKQGEESTDLERAKALEVLSKTKRRVTAVLARTLKDVRWTTTIGSPPEWIRQNISAN